MISARDIKGALDCGRPGCSCRTNGLTHCPAHDDTHPSLSVSPGKSVAVVVNCHAGCDSETVITQLRARSLWHSENDATPPNVPRRARAMRLTQEWTYERDGVPVAVHGRFEDGTGAKDVRWRLPDGDYEHGLRGMKLAELPLYNSGALAKYADTPALLVEGEPATDACIEHGLLAVSLAGGAAQKDFGAALDALKGRDVWLWPDNDEPGRELMRRVRTVLPHARYVSLPQDMPPKGDAVDYFASARPPADLFPPEFLAGTAEVTADSVTLRVAQDGGVIVFDFRDISTARQRFDADVTVTIQLPGFTARPFNAHLQLKSLSSIAEFRRTLDATYGKELPWAAILNEACQRAKDAYLGASVAEDIADVAPLTDERYRIDGLIPEYGTTIIFGQGSASKTFQVLDMCRCLTTGAAFLGRAVRPCRVLFLDFEGNAPTLSRRWRRLLAPHGIEAIPEAFHYMRGRGIPLADQMQTIRRELARTGAAVLVVDSAVSAIGANPLDAEYVGRNLALLNALEITVVVIAHVTKEGGEDFPFGSIFWHNLARMTWFVRRVDSEDSPDIRVGFFNKKANDDRRQKAFGVVVHFEDPNGPVTIEPYDLADEPELARGLSIPSRITRILSRGPRLTSQLAEECDEDPESIRRACTRLRKAGSIHGSVIPGEKEATWRLAALHTEAS